VGRQVIAAKFGADSGDSKDECASGTGIHGGHIMYGYSSVNNNLSSGSYRALGNLGTIKSELESSLQALGTGYKYSKSSDNPAAVVEITRLQGLIDAAKTASDNNQQAYYQLSGVDSAESEIIKRIMEIRTAVQDAIAETDPAVKQTLLQEVSSALGGIDSLANSVSAGGKKVLAGEGGFDMSDASDLLDIDDSYIRSVRKNAYVTTSFSGSNAAEQAVLSDAYTLAAATESVFKISSNSGARTIHLAGGLSLEQALSQMNKQLRDINVHVDESGGSLYFASDDFGDDAVVEYEHVSGSQLLNGGDATDYGKTGSITVNGKVYDLEGETNNNEPEKATVASSYAASVLAGTTITIATENQTGATYTFAVDTTIDATAISAMDTFFSNYGVRVSEADGELVFSSKEEGEGSVVHYSNTGTQLLDDGADITETGRDYDPGDGLDLNITTVDISAHFSFDSDKILKNAISGAAPADVHFSFEPEGGVYYQIGDGTDYYDSVTYGFKDLTSEGLGLDQLVDNSSGFYMLDNPEQALKLVDAILAGVEEDYGALGSFMNDFLDAQTSNLDSMIEALSQQEEELADVDEAYETAKVAKLQILQQANISSLSAENSYANAIAQLLPSIG